MRWVPDLVWIKTAVPPRPNSAEKAFVRTTNSLIAEMLTFCWDMPSEESSLLLTPK